jgi:DNA ligase-1
MITFPTLFKRTSTNAKQQWTIIVEGATYFTEAGQVGGIINRTEPTKCIGKNIGKSNETTDEEQAYVEAKSKWDKKLRLDYTEDITAVDSAKTRNFMPMLAKKFQDRKDKVIYPCYTQRKSDGIRCILTAEGGFTRNGEKHATIPHIEKLFKPIFEEYPDAIFDGELYNHDLHDEFEELCSLIRKKKPTINDLFDAEEKIQYHIFDCPIIGDLIQEDPFIDRYNEMVRILISYKLANTKSIKIVYTYILNSEADVESYQHQFLDEGYEGIIIRINGPYENKRSSYLLKLKIFDDDEFEITDVVPGKGNRETWAAKVWCKTKNNEPFKAGIIGNKLFCQTLLANKNNVIGKEGTVRYFGFTNGNLPRHGKLKCIRDYE